MRIISPTPSSYDDEDISNIRNIGEEIKVVLRVRPLNERETDLDVIKSSAGLRSWKILNEYNAITQILTDDTDVKPSTANKKRAPSRSIYTYDRVYDESNQTKEIYEFVARENVLHAVSGRNASIFAYGQTSSGKTYTMQGSESISRCMESKKQGFIHLAAADIFHEIGKSKDRDYKVFASVIEVYNEYVRDLLVDIDSSKTNSLKITENSKTNGIYVNPIKKEAKSLSQLLAILGSGENRRSVAETSLNKRSSRSHLIYSIVLESKPRRGTSTFPNRTHDMEITQTSTLNLIDLAGSESVRHRSDDISDKSRKEGGNINKR